MWNLHGNGRLGNTTATWCPGTLQFVLLFWWRTRSRHRSRRRSCSHALFNFWSSRYHENELVVTTKNEKSWLPVAPVGYFIFVETVFGYLIFVVAVISCDFMSKRAAASVDELASKRPKTDVNPRNMPCGLMSVQDVQDEFAKTWESTTLEYMKWNGNKYEIMVDVRPHFVRLYREAAKTVVERRLLPNMQKLDMKKLEQVDSSIVDTYKQYVSDVKCILNLDCELELGKQSGRCTLHHLSMLNLKNPVQYQTYQDWRYVHSFFCSCF